MIWARKLDKTL